MRRRMRTSVLALLATLGIMATSVGVASPAQAFPNDGWWRFSYLDTGKCDRVAGSDWSWGWDNGDCIAYNQSRTRFKKDDGGVALVTEYNLPGKGGNDPVARIEWHPNGEIFKVCDLKNDGDTIYARLSWKQNGNWYAKPLVSPPGTSKVVECTTANYDFAEGTPIQVAVYDDKYMVDWMASFTGFARA